LSVPARASSTLNRYLIREIATAMFAAAIILMTIVFAGLLTDVLAKITQGRFPAELIVSQMALRVPMAIVLLLPLAGFIGVTLAYSRLYRDSELAVLRASGYSELGLLAPVLRFALPMAAVIAYAALYLAPAAQRIAIDQAELANRQLAVAGLEPGNFLHLKSNDTVIFAGALESKKSFKDVLIVREMPNEVLQVVRAESGEVISEQKNSPTMLRLKNGQRTDVTLGKNDIERASFERADLVLPENLQPQRGYRMEDLAITDLPEAPNGRAELQARLSAPLMLLLLMLLAPALARSAPRQVRYDRIVIGVLMFLVYSQAIELAKRAMSLGKTPEWLGIWWVHLLFAIIVLLCYRAQLLIAWRGRKTLARMKAASGQL
jgi:lipopolysaccharide export system permease protein